MLTFAATVVAPVGAVAVLVVVDAVVVAAAVEVEVVDVVVAAWMFVLCGVMYCSTSSPRFHTTICIH